MEMELVEKFATIKQCRNERVREFTSRFQELAWFYTCCLTPEKRLIYMFVKGLNANIKDFIPDKDLISWEKMIAAALLFEKENNRHLEETNALNKKMGRVRNVRQEVTWSGCGVKPGEEVSSKRRFIEMSQTSQWTDLDDVRQLKAKLMGKRSNVGVKIIIVSDDDDDKEVVRDIRDTVMAETDDEIDSVGMDIDNVVVDIVGMSGVILKACVGATEGNNHEVTPSGNVKASGNVESQQLIPTRKSQRIQNQKIHAFALE
nr:zinc finger, CCHC-type, retrotransposon Gag domain protein [Tanacetum cinerariifolium]GEY49648.1 zinc finger, CCHC-type, retrotransposon Gag domain protein [Tanacetum cinerariifolium]